MAPTKNTTGRQNNRQRPTRISKRLAAEANKQPQTPRFSSRLAAKAANKPATSPNQNEVTRSPASTSTTANQVRKAPKERSQSQRSAPIKPDPEPQPSQTPGPGPQSIPKRLITYLYEYPNRLHSIKDVENNRIIFNHRRDADKPIRLTFDMRGKVTRVVNKETGEVIYDEVGDSR